MSDVISDPAATSEPASTPEPTALPDGHWATSIEDEGLRGAMASYESPDKLLEAIGYEPPKVEPGEPADWRDGLSEDAKKFAESSPDVKHLVDRAVALQKQVSTAIVPPGRDATDEEVAAYRKRIGVPEAPEGYKFELPDGAEPTDADKAFHEKLAQAFHASNVTADQAKALNEMWNEMTTSIQEAQVEADKQFAEATEAELRKMWPGKEYDTNKAHAERAAAWAFGDQLDEIRHMETKDGRFVTDHPIMLRALAMIGREMQEGGLVPPMAGDAMEQAQDQIKDLRVRAEKAAAEGDSREANRLYQEEQALIAKTQGNRPVVGAAGRQA